VKTTKEKKVLLHRLRQHKSSVRAVAINCTDELLATVGGRDDNALVIWDLNSGTAICGKPAHSGESALAMAWQHHNANRLITCGSRHVRVWHVDISQPKLHPMDASLGNLKRVMRCLDIGTNDDFAYIGTTTGEVLKFSIARDGIHKPNDPDRIRPMLKKVSKNRVGSGVTSIAVWTNKISGNDNIIIGAGDGMIILYNSELNQVHAKKEAVQGAITSICLSKHDTFYLGTDEANRYRLSIQNWQPELLATAHAGAVKDIVFPQNCSDLFVTCSTGGDVRVWNAKKRLELLRICVPNLECDTIAVANYGAEIVSGWSDGRVRSFYPESGKLKFVINDAHVDGVTALAEVSRKTSSNSWTLITGGRDGRIRGWRITSSHQPMIFSIKEHRAAITALRVSNDATKVISASADGSCLCFCLETQVRKLALFESNVFTQISWHPDESQLLTTGSNYKISYYDAYDASTIRVIDGSFTDEMTALDVEPIDGAWFLTGSADKTIKLWSYDDGIAVAQGLGHAKRVNSLKIAPDRSTAVSVGNEGGIYVWALDQDLCPLPHK